MEEQRQADPLRGCEPAGPQLLQLRPDRRLGHEWDDWDGQPLPNDGIFHEPPGLFFRLLAAGTGAAALGAATGLWFVAPRLEALWAPLPGALWVGLALAVAVSAAWLLLLAISVRIGRVLLPPRAAERGLLPFVMPLAEHTGRWFGISRDRAGNAALRVYNALAAARARPGGIRPDQLLVLLPRCLDKESMQGAMDVSARYGVPLFVASRGRYAREMIARVRPRAVVAVACERDLVSGVHDVAAKLPVLGTTIGLPDGPCKNTKVDVASLEERICTFLGLDARAR
ncbi:MAG TPA: DUF116 domain-containing protein [Longimicrobiales bacterium]